MIFLHPWFLLLLVILPFLIILVKKSDIYNSTWAKIVDKELLEFLSNGGQTKASKSLWWLTVLAMFSLIIAISGPSWQKTEIPNFTEQNAVMIALDLSSDTKEQDLDKFKFAIQDLINETNELNLGLIVYSNEPFLISPITEDKNIIKNLLSQIDLTIMPENGNNINKAKSYANQKLKDAGFSSGEVVVLSNNEPTNIENIINKLNAKQAQLTQSNNKTIEWQNCGYYFLFLPALVCLYMFRKGLFVFILLFSFNANANIFLNKNQQGQKAFNQGDYKTAQQKFDNKDWKAASMYKSGDYKSAINLFSDKYNQGNALAKSGDIEGAIKKYEEVLAVDKDHKDAKFNLEYLKKQQQQQQQQQNQQQNQDNKENKEDQQQNQQQDQQQNQDKDKQQKQEQQKQDEQKQDEQNKEEQNKEEKQKQEQVGDRSSVPQQEEQKEQGKEDKEGKQAQSSTDLKEAKENKDAQKQEGYTEQAQAREQQFREIPEDTGGLLRAFIYKEYQNRKGY